MPNKEVKPRVTLVGAGPGDPDLISVKGVNALAKADVVFYDALVSKELLKYASIDAIKVYVGKRANNHRYPQEQINRMLVEYAYNNGHVVRLKGGDSFVFGRGHEEMVYAEAFDVKVEVIPGITSAIAVPELQRIPVTKRGTSESFWVITGTTRSGKLSADISLAAQSSATIIILMGMGKLEQIVETFKAHGKNELPVAVIQNGSMPIERTSLGTINSIVDVVREEKIGTPAIIMIGEVVKEHPMKNWDLVEKAYLKNNTSIN